MSLLHRIAAPLAGALVALLAACGPVEPSIDERCQKRLPGDLVISEFMIDPAGADDSGHEWIELYNATGAEIDLKGMTLAVASKSKEYVFNTAVVPAGGYFVAGNSRADPRPTYENQSYGDKLGLLPNSNATLQVRCGSKVLDEVTYTAPKGVNGHSNELDGKLIPDSAVNDQEASYCSANTQLDEQSYGTPGRANAHCGTAASTNCTDPITGQNRAPIKPAPGELVITELMVDSGAVLDTDGEWFELHAPTRAVDLNGLMVQSGTSTATLTSATCLSVGAGAYVILAHKEDAAVNGGLPQVIGVFSASLPNASGTLAIRNGDVLLDEVSWTGSTSGAALQLDAEKLTATDNDDPLAFCPATAPYGLGDLGTPGAANAVCPPVVKPGECLDQAGLPRAIVRPLAGELVITELMPDPAIVSDTDGEWFELYAPTRTVDLNELVVESGASSGAVDSVNCISVTAGSYVVFGKGKDPEVNGGLPFVTTTFSPSMGNTAGSLRVRDGATVIDEVSWTKSHGGASWQLGPDKLNSVDNDDPLAFCPSQLPYGKGDLGSPGAANAACPPVVRPGECFDAEVGAVRNIVKPAAGDLVITELMQNPDSTDSGKEWFELTAMRTVDLNGLRVEAKSSTATNFSGTDLTANDCLPLPAGSFALFAGETDFALNGGLPFVTFKITFSLTNSAGTLRVMDGTTELDAFTWTSTSDGASTQLDNTKYSPVFNDDPANSCPGLIPYGPDVLNKGTPGAENHGCGSESSPKCFDASNSTVRDVLLPQPGDLVITELHQNPQAVDDALGEYFEVLVNQTVDLNGLQIANEGTGNTTLKATNCIGATAGSLLVFGRKTDALVNGGLPPLAGTFAFGLGNYGTVVAPKALILRRGAFELDRVTWTSSTNGASTQLSSDKLDTTSNDLPASFCATTAVYGSGDKGTPGQANELCP